MYNILIVDDEPIIRKGMKQFLDWDQYGFAIIGEAANGFEALRFAQNNQVDLLITDIKMPGMDGLELVEKLHEQNLYPYVTVLSGYGEFEYARRAINQGVQSYLLKPIQEEELIDMLQRIKRKLDEDAQSREVPVSIAEKVIRSLNLTSPPKKNIRQILDFMEKNMAKNLTLEQIGEAFLLSPNYISTLFKAQLGAGFQTVMIQMRILKAKELLATQHTLKVYEIASQVGYEDVQYFDRLFKKKVGISPREYRDSLQ